MATTPRVLLHSFHRQRRYETRSPSHVSNATSQASQSTYPSHPSYSPRTAFPPRLDNDNPAPGSIRQDSITSSVGTGRTHPRFRNPFKRKTDLVAQLEKAEREEMEREELELTGGYKRPGLVRQGTSLLKRRFSLGREYKVVVEPQGGQNDLADEEEMIMIDDSFGSSIDYRFPNQQHTSPTHNIRGMIPNYKKVSQMPFSKKNKGPNQESTETRSKMRLLNSGRETKIDSQEGLAVPGDDETPRRTPGGRLRPKSMYGKRAESAVSILSLEKREARQSRYQPRISAKDDLLNSPLPDHTPQGLPSRYRPNGTTIFDIYPDEDLDYHPNPPLSSALTRPQTIHPRRSNTVNSNRRSSRVFDFPNALYDLWQYGLDDPEVQELSLDEEELARRRILPMFVHIRSTNKIPTRAQVQHSSIDSTSTERAISSEFRMQVSSPSTSSKGSVGVVQEGRFEPLTFVKPTTAVSNLSSPLEAYFGDFDGYALTESISDYSPIAPSFSTDTSRGKAL